MGQIPDDLNEEIPAVEAEVDALRERTQQIVAELERRLRARAAQAKTTIARVKRATDVRAQLKAHPRVTIGVSSMAAIALGLGVYVTVARMLERRKPMNRLKGRLYAYKALLADPHRALRKKEPVGKRLIAAVLIAGATTIVKALSAILMKRVAAPAMLPPHQAEHVDIKS
ncbi:MAG: hypothetical protein LC659_14200 [Myxococcales bacterium]|nr:hypothetical protein [Myxococcales bacterium]